MKKINQYKASAGSGKTHKLTSLFIEALARCAPESPNAGSALGGIMAITFTNASAADMRDKVIERLKMAALGKDTKAEIAKEQAEAWLDIILRDMDNLNIRTIDSLLHMIVRSAALDLNLRPDFEPVFETPEALNPFLELFLIKAGAAGNNLARQQLEEACEGLAQYGSQASSGGRRIIKFTGENRFRDSLYLFADSILKNEFVNLTPAPMLRKRFEELCGKVGQTAAVFLEAGNRLRDKGWEWKKDNEKALTGLANEEMDILEGKSALADAAEKFFKKNKNGELPQNVRDAFQNYHESAARLAPNYKILKNAVKFAPFIELAGALADGYSRNMRCEEVCPTAIVPVLASKALNSSAGVSDALVRLGNMLKHFLIDEFQDTSEEQWQAIEPLVINALAENGTFTWVGDTKQSVYGWRNAEPALFDNIPKFLRHAYEDGEFERGELKTNWRSYPEIVNFNNMLFKPLGEKDESEKEQCLARQLVKNAISDIPDDCLEKILERINSAFADTEQKISDKHAGKGGYVEIREVPPGSMENLSPEMAREIVKLVNRVNKRRPLSDILILCRNNWQASYIAESLIANDINIITNNSLLLSAHPLICQTLSFLRYLDNPDNDIAFWNVITGTLLGKFPSHQDRQNLALCACDAGKNRLADSFAARFAGDWEGVLKPFHDQANILPPYDIVAEWYRFLDAEKRFPQDRTFLRRFLEILHQTETEGIDTISGFLDWWQTAGSGEKAPMPEKMDAVRIMTIHKAKGLQAPVTIVPWTNFTLGANNLDPIIMDGVEGMKMVVPVIKECGLPYYQLRANQFAEILDILYVAFTRAEEELYIFCPPPATARHDKLAITQLLEKSGIELPASFGVDPGQPTEGENSASGGSDSKSATGNAPEENIAGVEKYPEGYVPMDWLPPMKVFQNIPALEAHKPRQFNPFPADRRGTFLHFCIENMRVGRSAEEAARNALDFGLAYSGIPVPNDSELRESLLDTLLWFAHLPQRERWLRNGLPEQSFIDAGGEVMRVDNLVSEPWGNLIIDYKSGNRDEEHLLQVRKYIDCISHCPEFPVKTRALLIYLDQKKFVLVEGDSASEPLDSLPEEIFGVK